MNLMHSAKTDELDFVGKSPTEKNHERLIPMKLRLLEKPVHDLESHRPKEDST